MRTNRPLAALTALLLITFLAGPAAAFSFRGGGEKGSGDLETRTFDLDDFDEMSVGGAFDVDVRFGDKQEVAVTIDDNLWDNLEVEVRRGRLVIEWDESCRPDDDCHIAITVSRLKAMQIGGAADVEIHDFDGESFEFQVSGAAELTMNGKVGDLGIKVSGAGEIDTRDLQAKHVKVRISGAGNANITATESLDAEVSGVGSIDYWGDPADKSTTVSGLGSIDSH